jgi:flagellar biosynthesis/type III secretory pathway chaperone
MANDTMDWSVLDRSLQHDTALAQQLLGILEQERAALEARQYEQFEQFLQAKHGLLASLERNTTARRHWLAKRGFADDASALQAAQLHAPHVAQQWHDAAEQWRACQHANQVNEQICNRTRIVVEKVLDVLRGQPGQGSTYDARGLSQRQNGGRPITNA